jgi:hypothetical protein
MQQKLKNTVLTFMAKKFYLLLLLIIFLFPNLSLAQVQATFSYQKSRVEIWINQDSTIEVVEEDLIVLNGFLERLNHKFLNKKIDYLTRLEVLDAQGRPLEKKDYTFTNSKAKEKVSIDWLIPKRTYVNEAVKYTLKYKVYGALSLLADRDELVWSLLPAGSGLSQVEAIVHLPNHSAIKNEDLKIDLETNAITVSKDIYRTDKSVYDIIKASEFIRPVASYYLADNSVYFIGQNLKKDSFFNIKVSWPKNLVMKPKVSYGQALNWLIGGGILIIFIGYLVYYRCFGRKKLQKAKEEEEK